jgi:hypothetical protein
MTLKDKFRPLVWFNSGSFNVHQNKEKDENSIKCEKIAEEFAISFSDWCFMKNVRFFDDTEQGMIFKIDIYKTKYTTKELLEIFKKEKGL